MYVPQVNRPELEKKRFYDQLQYIVTMVPATEILIPVGDWKGPINTSPVCSPMPMVCSASVPNKKDEKILEFTIANSVHISNTWFKKRDAHLITYSFGADSTQLDYIL